MDHLIVVSRAADWAYSIPGVEVVEAAAYLADSAFLNRQDLRVFNLCRTYRYQSTGYYVSLLAEARGHRAIPDVATIQDMKSASIVRVISDDVDELIQKSLARLKSDRFQLSIYFGKNSARRYEALSRRLYNLFQAPFLRAQFSFNGRWELKAITPIPLNQIPEGHRDYVTEFGKDYFSRKRFRRRASRRGGVYDLAILIDPSEQNPPSDGPAIDRFVAAASEGGFEPELISRDDYSRLGEFDALFLRATTAVNHFTYRFARRAEQEGIAVLDDPASIMKCSNKVYLAELLSANRIRTPRTLILHRGRSPDVAPLLGFPCILKEPDSSFSQGVSRVEDPASLAQELERLFRQSDLVIAQEFLPTEFDWRIGVLDHRPLFACRYFMARNYWKVTDWRGGGDGIEGLWETVRLEDAPASVVRMAVRASNLIGDGFYGVDLKQAAGGIHVIEVNDNPSVDSDVEDAVLGKNLYRTVIQSLLRRVRDLHRSR